MRKGVSRVSDLRGGGNLGMLGAGNVYRVIKADEAYYDQFMADHQFEHSDGSAAVHPDAGTGDGIQSALDACVANRNDYVLVQSAASDYDLTAALTLSKKSVHLIGPAGLGNTIGSTNACRLHQNTGATPVFTVSDSSIEIAGFYIKNYSKITTLELAQGTYAPNIHNNSFIMMLASTDSEPIIDNVVTGNTLNDGGAWGAIERNWFTIGAGDTNTTIAKIVNIHTQATTARFQHNEITIGDDVTVTVGVYNDAVKGRTDYNTFGTGGGAYGGTFTHCVHVNASGSAIGNRGTVADSLLVVGGTSDASFSDNMNAVDGGAVDDEDAAGG